MNRAMVVAIVLFLSGQHIYPESFCNGRDSEQYYLKSEFLMQSKQWRAIARFKTVESYSKLQRFSG